MLRFLPFHGPLEFKFIDPDTGFQYKAPNRAALINHIMSYRIQNNLPPIDAISTVLDHYLCSLPENLGSCQEYGMPRGLLMTIKGGISLLKNMLYSSYVSKEEADRRAKVCLGCPHNVFPDKTSFVAWADEVAEASLQGRRSDHHKELGNCEVCTCLLRSKVFYGGKIDIDPKERLKYPDFCWQLTANETSPQNLEKKVDKMGYRK